MALGDAMATAGRTEERRRKNTYDRLDRVERGNLMRAGPLKLATYRVRDPDTDEWGPWQFHMTYDNHVMAVMSEQAAKLFATFYADFEKCQRGERPYWSNAKLGDGVTDLKSPPNQPASNE